MPKPLSATHQYFPDRSLPAMKRSVFPVLRVDPSLTHVMFGVGLPLAVQRNVTLSFSITVLSAGSVVKLGGTVVKLNTKIAPVKYWL